MCVYTYYMHILYASTNVGIHVYAYLLMEIYMEISISRKGWEGCLLPDPVLDVQ